MSDKCGSSLRQLKELQLINVQHLLVQSWASSVKDRFDAERCYTPGYVCSAGYKVQFRTGAVLDMPTICRFSLELVPSRTG